MRFLAEHGYPQSSVTFDNSDWMFAYVYRQARELPALFSYAELLFPSEVFLAILAALREMIPTRATVAAARQSPTSPRGFAMLTSGISGNNDEAQRL